MRTDRKTRQALAAIPGGQMGGPGAGPTGGDYSPIIPQTIPDCQSIRPDDLRRYVAGLLAEAATWLDIANTLEGQS